ncbi:MAG: hypothetical protein ACE5NC_01725 [Anaerolineae bacterium]
MRRILPLAIAVATGTVVLIDLFVEAPYLDPAGAILVEWVVILAAFALVLGMLNVVTHHLRRIRRRAKGWPYSSLLLLAVAVVLFAGLTSARGPQDPIVQFIFQNVQVPLQTSFFALLAFYTAFAAYRAFRVRNVASFLMVAAGAIVLIGQIPAVGDLWASAPDLRSWLLEVPSTAGARGILLGVALGAIATAFRILLGMDRPYAR